jgi:hypothetical protein
MTLIASGKQLFRRAPYKKEAELEAAVEFVKGDLFGPGRVYLPVKKKIGARGGAQNIPDGYLIDLGGSQPRLYVVENELAAHEPLKHIAVQILNFSLSFEAGGRGVKSVLFDAVHQDAKVREKCERYVAKHEFRNLDHLLDHLVFDTPFAALVIIDELPEELETVLAERFKFGVEVLELARYRNAAGSFLYRFKPFLEEVTPDLSAVDFADVDTVVVPARADGVTETFLGENRWYAVRINGAMRPQIKHIAVYEVAPVSAITYVADVKQIEPWKQSGKCVVNFSAKARKIGPIKLVKKGRVKGPQNLRYTTLKRLEKARTLDDVW